jgi:DNA invertase Pin-like site-specific DNA recombinase
MAKRDGLKVVDTLKEEKSARKSANREVFEEMMDEIRRENSLYNSIICWHPDRLGRNMKDAGEIIDLIDRGIIKDLKFLSFLSIVIPMD